MKRKGNANNSSSSSHKRSSGSSSSGGGVKVDKYEQVLARYDWHAEQPPRGYVYGVGRGAKGFVTTAELSVARHVAQPTPDERAFLDTLEQLEQRPRARATAAAAPPPQVASSSSTSTATPRRLTLSADDVAAIESSALHATALVPRSARDEGAQAADEYAFADERVVTTQDVLHGRLSAAQRNLANLLAMGSPDEQNTWITHARAYREMAMHRKALQTLAEGCARTGRQGSRIWLERLDYMTALHESSAARRRLLEDAVTACAGDEALWLALLPYEPAHEQLHWLQRAVLACPTSERLWLRVLRYVPEVAQQRKLLQRALQHSPQLPRLWARLARLESPAVGRDVFRAAGRQYASFDLVVEAAKYAEWCAWRAHTTTTTTSCALAWRPLSSAQWRALHVELASLVRAARDTYLDVRVEALRRRWLQAAEDAAATTTTTTSSSASSSDSSSSTTTTAAAAVAGEAYVWTAGCLYAYALLPSTVTELFATPDNNNNNNDNNSASRGPLLASRPSSSMLRGILRGAWVDDVTLYTHTPWARHDVVCALWAAWLLLQRARDECSSSSSDDDDDDCDDDDDDVNVDDDDASDDDEDDSSGRDTTPSCIVRVVCAAIATAPAVVLRDHVDALLDIAYTSDATLSHDAAVALAADDDDKDGNDTEQEALPTRAANDRANTAAATQTTAALSSQHSSGSDGCCSNSSHALPPPLLGVLPYTLQLLCERARAAQDVHTPQQRHTRRGMASLRLLLRIAHALHARGHYTAALHVLQRGHALVTDNDDDDNDNEGSHAATMTASDVAAWLRGRRRLRVRIVVAMAMAYAALGWPARADALLDAEVTRRRRRHAQRAQRDKQQQQNVYDDDDDEDDTVWVKLAIHRRSGGADVRALLHDAVAHCPRSPRLWRMLLDCARVDVQAALATTTTTANASATTTTSAHEACVRELRQLCARAVAPAHCARRVRLWAYIARRIESELLGSAAMARAVLQDAHVACTRYTTGMRTTVAATTSNSKHTTTSASSSSGALRDASVRVCLGVARAHVELRHGSTATALDVVHEALQRLPKTRDGALAVRAGELLALRIDLEVPASRGRVAALVMRQWRSREPLALAAVARLYHAARQHARALTQALRAVRRSRGRCGDVAALLWKLALRAEYAEHVRPHLQHAGVWSAALQQLYAQQQQQQQDDAADTTTRDGAAATAVLVSSSALYDEAVRQWVWWVAHCAATRSNSGSTHDGAVDEDDAVTADGDNNNSNKTDAHTQDTTASVAAAAAWQPRYGPLWCAVARDDDPRNVTLLGYRASTETMLRAVMARIALD